MNSKMIALSLSAVLLLGGCNQVKNEDTGHVVGGILGGVLGSTIGDGKGKTVATVVGTLAGAMIGGAVGRSMDAQDQANAERALEYSRTGDTVAWHNPDTGNEFEVTPTRTYSANNGSACRDYTTDAWIDGRKETIVGTACRQSDGSWRNM